MQKFTLFVVLVVFSYCTSFSQELFVEGNSSNSFLKHKVVPKENWYSVGRLYNVHPKDLASYNKSSVEKGLQIDQLILVPINVQNKLDFFASIAEGEAKVPLYYKVKKDDGLYRIAVNNGTTMQAVREWSSLKNDTLIIGQKLIVGFIKVKVNESSLVNSSLNNLPAATNPIVKNEPVTTTTGPTPTVEIKTEESKPTIVNTKPGADIIVDETRMKPTEPTKEETELPIAAKKEEPKPVEPVEFNAIGFYKNGFKLNGKQETSRVVNCNTFKVSAGWDDDKYYAFVNDIAPGSVVKIINTKNNKTVYAMVLDNNKIYTKLKNTNCAISNATAYALGIKDSVFEINIVTGKN